MSTINACVEWFNSNIKPILIHKFELKYINEKDGDLGDLFGVLFDSIEKGGYIYFWSSGYVSFQLVDYINEVELVEDTTEEINSRPYDLIFDKLISCMK